MKELERVRKTLKLELWSCRESNPGPNRNRVALSTRVVLLDFRDRPGALQTQTILILRYKFWLGRNTPKLSQIIDRL